MKTIISGEYTFEIVESIPRNYFIWNIGKNMIDGYLPLCSLAGKQPFKGAQCIDVISIHALREESDNVEHIHMLKYNEYFNPRSP